MTSTPVVGLADDAGDVEARGERRQVVVRHGEALHVEARGAVLQDLVEGRNAVGRDPAIGLVEGQKAGHVGLDDGDQAQAPCRSRW